MDFQTRQATINAGYNDYILRNTGQLPACFGDDSLVNVVSLESNGAVVEFNGISSFIPYLYLTMKGDNHNAQATKAHQAGNA